MGNRHDRLPRERLRRSGACALIALALALLGWAVPAQAVPTPNTTITSGPPALTNATTALFSFSSTGKNATFTCRLDTGATVACTSPAGYSGLTQGSHSFSVTSTAGGITDPTPAVQTWTVDVTAPAAPTNLAASTPSSTSVALTWTAGTDNTGVTGNQILRDGALLATLGAVTSYTDSTVTAGSTHSYAVRAVDGAGNVSATSSALSVTTPAAPAAPDTVIDSGPAALTNATGASFTFHATLSGATFSCVLDGGKPGACTSPQTYNRVQRGSHVFSVAATVNGVTDATAATLAWTVDTTAPAAPANVTAAVQGASVVVNWAASTDNTGVTGYDVFRDGNLLVSLGTVLTYTDSGMTPATGYRYAVRARDGAGNVSALSADALAIPMAPYDPHLTRAPYLTDLVGNHVAINFATDQSATNASVKYGAVDSGGNCTPGTTVTPGRTSIVVGTVSQYQWTAQLDLPAQGSYCYRVYLGSSDLLGANPTPRFASQLPFGSTSSFSFDVMGDWGDVDANGNNADQANLLAQVAMSGARFMVTVGDNGYQNGSQINYGDLQQTGADTSAIFGPQFWTVPGRSLPIFTAAGNHGLSGVAHTDITTWTQATAVSTSGGRYQNDVYCCVNGSSPANYGSEWYAFSVGNARFYVLDSAWGDTNGGTASPYANDAAAHFTPGTPEYEWLVNDLATHPTQLKFAFSHFPFYSDNNTQPSDVYLQGPANLEGLLAQNGVQIVFNGHAHIYERNNPSAAGMPITYVTGGGGATPEPVGPCNSYDAYAIGWSPTTLTGTSCGSAGPPATAANIFHFLKVTVSGTSVTVTPTDSLGNTFDVRTYTFSVPPDTYLDSAPPAGTTATSATFSFHASGSPATYSCQLDGGAAAACTSPTTYSGLAEGSHTFTVAATVGGQADPTPARATWTVDATAPSPPTGLAAGTPSPFQVDLSWTAAADNTGVTGYRIYRDGTFYRSLGAVTSFSDAVLGGSTHQYAVSAVDIAGNESARSTAVTATTPPPPAPVFSDGFETGDLSAWTSAGGLSVQSTTVNTGTYAAEGNTTNGSTFARKTLATTYPDAYARVLVDLVSASSQVNVLRLRDAAGLSLGYVYVDTSGQLGFHNDALGTNTSSNVTVGPGWHAIELHLGADSSAGTPDGVVEVWLDNARVTELSSTGVDVGAAPVGGVQIGDLQTGRTYDVVFDDAAFGTSRLGPAGDGTPPSTPTGLTAAASSPFQVGLGWNASTDDVAVAGYDVYRDGALLASVDGATTSYTDTTVLPSTSYQYQVRARDVSGNASALSAPVAVATPATALALFADGFESGDLSAWSSTAGLTVQSADTRSGTFAADASTSAGSTWAKKTLPGSYQDAYARVAFHVNSLGAQVTLLRLRDTPTGSGAYLYLTASGRLAFRSDALAAGTSSSTVPGPGWHALELHLFVNGTSSVVQTWLDGSPVAGLTFDAVDLGTAPIGVLQIGDTVTAGGWDVAFDDAAFATTRLGPSSDTTPPSTPQGVAVTTASAFEADVSWAASTDDSGVTGYDVFRDGALFRHVNAPATTFADTTVLAGETHQYAVRAWDAWRNVSPLSDPVGVTMPAADSPLFADGFESADLSAWTSSGGLVVQAGDVRSGGYAAEGNTTTGATYAKKTLPATYGDGYARVAFHVKSQTSQINLLRMRAPDGTSIGYLYLDASGRLGFHNDTAATNTVSTTVPAAGWHVLELRLGVTAGVVGVWLDGASVAVLSAVGANLGSASIGAFQIGETTTARTYDVVLDDAAFSTSRIGLS